MYEIKKALDQARCRILVYGNTSHVERLPRLSTLRDLSVSTSVHVHVFGHLRQEHSVNDVVEGKLAFKDGPLKNGVWRSFGTWDFLIIIRAMSIF
jgi:hypothetical protein